MLIVSFIAYFIPLLKDLLNDYVLIIIHGAMHLYTDKNLNEFSLRCRLLRNTFK